MLTKTIECPWYEGSESAEKDSWLGSLLILIVLGFTALVHWDDED